MPELLMEIRATYNVKKKDAPTEEEVVEKYSRCGVLVLDDLGAEKVTDFSITTLYLIIDRRNRDLRPTIVTTNLSLQEIGEKIDGRISSRLSEMKIVHLALPDYRKRR
jgi:DNA replication protein DnaC